MAQKSDTTIVVDMILGGQLDGEFGLVYDAIRQRERLVGRQKLRALRKGDRVIFNEKISPRYLIGVEATVVKPNQTTVTIKLDDPTGRFGTRPMRAPIATLELVE